MIKSIFLLAILVSISLGDFVPSNMIAKTAKRNMTYKPTLADAAYAGTAVLAKWWFLKQISSRFGLDLSFITKRPIRGADALPIFLYGIKTHPSPGGLKHALEYAISSATLNYQAAQAILPPNHPSLKHAEAQIDLALARYLEYDGYLDALVIDFGISPEGYFTIMSLCLNATQSLDHALNLNKTYKITIS